MAQSVHALRAARGLLLGGSSGPSLRIHDWCHLDASLRVPLIKFVQARVLPRIPAFFIFLILLLLYILLVPVCDAGALRAEQSP